MMNTHYELYMYHNDIACLHIEFLRHIKIIMSIPHNNHSLYRSISDVTKT